MRNEDWSSVYGSSLSPSFANQKFETKPGSLGSGNIYVLSCEFSACKSTSSNGGAIQISSSSSTKMLLEKCVFFQCQTVTSGDGGAIYFGEEGNWLFMKCVALAVVVLVIMVIFLMFNASKIQHRSIEWSIVWLTLHWTKLS